MSEKYMKITYQGQPPAKKLNAYLRMPSQTYAVLRLEIEMYLFQERQLPKAEIKTFGLTPIMMKSRSSIKSTMIFFLSKCGISMHLQIAAIKETVKGKSAPARDTSDSIIHYKITCDSCGLTPLVGFRYKCIQCPDLDLCQACEAFRRHPHHMMIRMPTYDEKYKVLRKASCPHDPFAGNGWEIVRNS